MQIRNDDAVDRVRAVRRRISESVGNDPEALVRHYQQLDRQQEERMLRNQRPKAEERRA